MEYKHAFGLIVYPGNQTVMVTVDVENGSSTYDVCMCEVPSHLGQRTPVSCLRYPIPVHQRNQRIDVPFRKIEDGRFADYPHFSSLQNVNYVCQSMLNRVPHFSARERPYLVNAMHRCLTALLLAVNGIAQSEIKTTVTPLPDEEILNPCEYLLVLPTAQPLRAVWTIWDRGQDYLKWFRDPVIRQFADEHKLALVLASHCRSKEREDMIVIPEKGVGRSLFTALEQFATSQHRAELNSVPIIHLGWSGAGSLVARMAAYHPERYLAGIGYAPGQYEPLGMDTIVLDAKAIRAPQLIIANGADKVNGTERPYAYFKKYLDQGAPWTFVVQNRTPHCCLQNAQALILEWLRAVLSTKRNVSFGYITTEASTVVDEWKRPVFNAAGARVVQRRRKPTNTELPAGWLPSKKFALEWLSFEQRKEPPAIWKP